MTNSEKFIDSYNKIDNHLKNIDNHSSHDSFTYKVKSSRNNVVRRFRDELISFGELRNAIVHTPRVGEEEIIAEPHNSTVSRISELYDKINNPKKVYPKFKFEVDILGAKKDDFINDILIQMRKYSFSQIPVFDDSGNVCELINNNTISRWLSSQLEKDGTIMIENAKVGNLLDEIEFDENYEFVSRDLSVYEAHDLFIEHININKRNLDVLFITHSGKPNEKLLGLITIEDIATLV